MGWHDGLPAGCLLDWVPGRQDGPAVGCADGGVAGCPDLAGLHAGGAVGCRLGREDGCDRGEQEEGEEDAYDDAMAEQTAVRWVEKMDGL